MKCTLLIQHQLPSSQPTVYYKTFNTTLDPRELVKQALSAFIKDPKFNTNHCICILVKHPEPTSKNSSSASEHPTTGH